MSYCQNKTTNTQIEFEYLFRLFLQDVLFDVAKKSGYLYNALRYRKKKRRMEQPLLHDASIATLTEDEQNEIFNFFKRCIPNDLQTIKERMLTSTFFRRDLVLTDFDKYMEMWDFYFVSPELVRYRVSFNFSSKYAHLFYLPQFLYDFQLMFENAKDTALLDVWSQIKNDPFTKFNIVVDKSKYPIAKKDEDIFHFLMFMKLIPTPRNAFEKAVKSLLVFSEVCRRFLLI